AAAALFFPSTASVRSQLSSFSVPQPSSASRSSDKWRSEHQERRTQANEEDICSRKCFACGGRQCVTRYHEASHGYRYCKIRDSSLSVGEQSLPRSQHTSSCSSQGDFLWINI
ncbi:unnamed protein product, partial [Brassica napus]